MTDVNAERLISVGTESLRTYGEVAEYMSDSPRGSHFIWRDAAIQACGGLVLGEDNLDYLYITDGLREGTRRRGGFESEGPVSISIDFMNKYEASGDLIAHVEPWDSELLDRGLAWLALSRNVVSAPVFKVQTLVIADILDLEEVAQRLENAELNATAMLDDFLNGVEQPRFSGDFQVQ